jgi:DNA-binding XRE family transcriptional regulator
MPKIRNMVLFSYQYIDLWYETSETRFMNTEEFNWKKAKGLAKGSGRTREWLAERCGITSRSLSRILNGKASPSCRVVRLFALAIKCDESKLYLKLDEKPRARERRMSLAPAVT